jgi:hypothetical protein
VIQTNLAALSNWKTPFLISASATKKKPGTKYPAFLFSDRRSLAGRRDENKKPKLCAAQRGFFFGLLPEMDQAERSEA